MNLEKYFFMNSKYLPLIEKEGKEEKKGEAILQEKVYVLHFDGCSKGNPGTAGAGAVIYEDGQEIYARSVFVGEHETNNVAEYTGLLIGMQSAIERGIRKLIVIGDSQLIIQQMLGEYRVKSPGLLALYQQVKKIERHFASVTYQHVYRNQNARADALSNEGLSNEGLLVR
jgi:ribonuclease HI